MKNNHPKPDQNPSEALREKYEFYLSEIRTAVDSYGFVGGHCDSLLFTSLAAYSGLEVDIFKAEKTPGEWHRHPSFDCYPNGGSDSTISKDMFTGLLILLASTNDARAARRIIEYGKAHNYFMGSAKDNATLVSKTLLSVSLINDFKKLAGLSLMDENSEDGIGVKDGFLGHLDVLRVYGDYLLYGGISSADLALSRAYCDHSPRNALYCGVYHRFSDGDFSQSLSILLNEGLFPSDHLPTSANRCTDYLWQREDQPKDWAPCEGEAEKYQGVDFLIAAKVILNR